MANGFNRVTLVGNLGDEPTIRQAQSGTSVATINLAINESRRDQNGQRTDITEWVRVVAFGKQAEIMGQYLHKGSQVLIEGRLRTRSYMDKDNNKRYITEVITDNLLMLGSKQNGVQSFSQGVSDYGQSNDYDQPQDPVRNSFASQNQQYGAQTASSGYGNGYSNNSYGNQRSFDSGMNQASMDNRAPLHNTYAQTASRPQNPYNTAPSVNSRQSQNQQMTANPDLQSSFDEDDELPF
ncbi:MAG: single-stranded DNA-binding protein [Succinivibrio sp.]